MSSGVDWVWDPHRRAYVYFDAASRIWRYADSRPVETAAPQATAGGEEEEEDEGGGAEDGAEEGADDEPRSENAVKTFQNYQRQRHYSYSTSPKDGQYTTRPGLSDITEGIATMSVAESSRTTDDGHSTFYGNLEREPKNEVTDPSLYNRGVISRGKIRATPGETEYLDAGFKRQRNPKDFFTPGKVFRILWPEQPGVRTENVTVITDVGGMRGAEVITKFRWFVVVKAGPQFCSCLPISTYQRRGVTKPSAIKSQHSVIYTGRDEPSLLHGEAPADGEKGMMQSIRVVPKRRTEKMDPTSRIDYSRIYTVDHYVKVKDFGDVHEKYVKRLRKQWWLVFKESLEIDSSEGDDGPGEEEGDYKEWVTATHAYDGLENTMTLEAGDRIGVLDYTTADWWKGLNTRTNVVSLFPPTYVSRDSDHTS